MRAIPGLRFWSAATGIRMLAQLIARDYKFFTAFALAEIVNIRPPSLPNGFTTRVSLFNGQQSALIRLEIRIHMFSPNQRLKKPPVPF
jgi:hypothetical protein